MRTLVKETEKRPTVIGLFGHYLHAIVIGLTFADLQTFKPPVLHISVAGTSAVLKPSTARSTTTGFAGFLERTALWAHNHRCGDGLSADCGSGDEFSFSDWPT